jgi:hypothetical protein
MDFATGAAIDVLSKPKAVSATDVPSNLVAAISIDALRASPPAAPK